MMSSQIFPNTSRSHTFAVAPDPDRPIRIARFFSYPDQVLYLITSFISFITFCHLASLVYTFSRRNRVLVHGSRPRTTTLAFRRLPRAFIDVFRALAFRWTISVGRSYTLNITELFLTAAYAAVLFTWTMINSTTTTGIKAEPHYWGNRAGTIAASQLPIMTALGMRNNLVSLLTGVSFDKLNYLHRMSARVLCVLVWLHGAGRLKVGLIDDEAIVNRWVQCGFLAASALTVLCLTTLRPVRHLSYEIFLILHFIFSLIFLLSLYFHAKGRHLVFYGVWPSFLLWGLDRFLRLARLIVFNFGSFKSISQTESSATISVLSHDFLRVTLDLPARFHWLPGQSAYLTFPGVSISPFEAHPFTISTIDKIDETDDQKQYKTLVFLVRVRNGFTRRLLQHAPGDKNTKVFLDGPYSSPPLLVGFNSVVFIAGGSGVAFTLPLFLDLVHRAKSGISACNRIVFIWAIRDADHTNWISDTLTSAINGLPVSTTIDIRFFDTGHDETQTSDDDASGENSDTKLSEGFYSNTSNASMVGVQRGRPDLQKILDEEIELAAETISVNVCGNYALANASREALRSLRFLEVLRGGPTISLHVEAFGDA